MSFGSSSSTINPLKKSQTKEDMERDFILSGEKERLKDIMVKRLKESGWANKVEQLIHDIIDQKGTEQVTVPSLVAEVTPTARKMVPEDVKRELMDLIKNFVNERTSDNEND